MAGRLLSLAVTALAAVAVGGSANSGVPCAADVLNFAPLFSPDSSRVAFLSGGGGGCVPHGVLLVAGVDEATAQVLDAGPDGAPTWNRDATSLAFEHYTGLVTPQIAVTGARGNGLRSLAEGRGPSWSPDGDRIAFYRDDGVYTVGLLAGTPIRIAEGASPAWSPQGTDIAIANRGVVLVRPDGSEARRLSDVEPRSPFLWSPTGTLLAFLGSDGATHVIGFGRPGFPFFSRDGMPPIAWSQDEDELVLRGGDSYITGKLARRFPIGEEIEALSPDWQHAVVGVVAGRFGYPGRDLYLADGDGLHPRLVSPSRCSTYFAHCVEGTDGRDKLTGTSGYDGIFGRAGDDEIYGLGGANHLEGAFGRDLLVGGPKNDVIQGQLGNDHLIGGAGIDILDGGPGDDLIETGRGTDFVGAGPGDDRILAADGWRDGIDCGPGKDAVDADPADHLELCEHVRRRQAK